MVRFWFGAVTGCRLNKIPQVSFMAAIVTSILLCFGGMYPPQSPHLPLPPQPSRTGQLKNMVPGGCLRLHMMHGLHQHILVWT